MFGGPKGIVRGFAVCLGVLRACKGVCSMFGGPKGIVRGFAVCLGVLRALVCSMFGVPKGFGLQYVWGS